MAAADEKSTKKSRSAVRVNPHHMAVVDWRLPTPKLRETLSELVRSPHARPHILALVPDHDEATLHEVLELGCDDFMTHPETREEVGRRMVSWFNPPRAARRLPVATRP